MAAAGDHRVTDHDQVKWQWMDAEDCAVFTLFSLYLECYAYRIDSAEGSVCYSGDSGGVAPALIELARGCDVLINT
jgi:ribonuclease BN (tRNA processing enzyme)